MLMNASRFGAVQRKSERRKSILARLLHCWCRQDLAFNSGWTQRFDACVARAHLDYGRRARELLIDVADDANHSLVRD
jgi:hypothetical protein